MQLSKKKILFFLGLIIVLATNCFATTASFTADHTSGCAGLYVNFTNSSSGATSYKWYFGNGNTSVLTSPSTTYLAAGTYTVKLVATGTSSADSTTISITIYDTPVVRFTADTLKCVGSIVHFSDSSSLNAPGSGSYSWNFGTGDTSQHKYPTYTYTTANKYLITLSVTNSAGCTTSLRKYSYVNIVGPPTADFYSADTLMCGPSANIVFNNSSTGTPAIASYSWSFGDTHTSTTTSPTHNYTALGKYTVRLIATNTAGCSDTATDSAYISLISITPSLSLSDTSTCIGNSITVQDKTAGSVFSDWHFGNGDSATGNPLSYTYNKSGTYTITLITSNGPCTDSTKKLMYVRTGPSINFSDTPSRPCPAPIGIHFNNTTTSGGTYKWEFGDDSTSTATNPTHSYLSNGFYDVTLIASNSYGCIDSLTKTAYVKIYEMDLEIIGNKDPGSTGICGSDTVFFTAALTYPTTGGPAPYPYVITSYSWDLGDHSYSSSATPYHIYSSVGNYKIVLTVTTINGCSKSDTFTVHVGSPPHADFYATPREACADTRIEFVDSIGGATSYIWDFGEKGTYANSGYGSSDSFAFVKLKYPGPHKITLVASNNGCIDSISKISYVTIDSPSALFSTNWSCDTNLRINFTNFSIGATSYAWDFGDGTTSTISSFYFNHIYPSAGHYPVVLATYNSRSGCRDTIKIGVDVYDPKVSITSSDTVVCLGQTVSITSSLAGITPRPPNAPSPGSTAYKWVLDGSVILSDTTSTIKYTFIDKGYHTIKAIIYDSSQVAPFTFCFDTLTKVNYIGIAKPNVRFGISNPETCAPATILFSDSSTDISGAPPSTSIWDFGDGIPITTTSRTITRYYPAGGSYYVKLTEKDNIGCEDSAYLPTGVFVHQPVAKFTSSTLNVCQGSPAYFYNASTDLPVGTLWYFGDGGTSTNIAPVHYYPSLGSYTVKLVITDTIGCKDSLTKTAFITEVAKPKTNFSLDDSFRICSPMTVNFTDHTSGAVAYAWDFNDAGGTAISKTPSWTYTIPNDYIVREIVTNSYTCSDTAYAHVRLLGYAGAFDYSPITGCAPLTVTFNSKIKSGIPEYIFDFADGYTIKTTATTVTHTYTKVGAIVPNIVFTNDSGCSSSSKGLDTIRVDGIKAGFMSLPFPACDSGNFEFIDTSTSSYSSIIYREWIFNDTTYTNVLNPYHKYVRGTYPITIIEKTSTGCIDTLNSSFTVFPLPIVKASNDTIICVGDGTILKPTGAVSYVWSPAATLSCTSCTYPIASPTTATLYTVIGTDINGCKNKDTVSVFTKVKTLSIADTGGQVCEGQTIQLNDSAGTGASYTWIPATGLSDPNNPHTLASPSTTTRYMVIAKQGSCIPDTEYVDLIVHPRPVINTGPDQTIVAGNSALLDVTGKYIQRYLCRPAATLSCDTCNNPVATPGNTTKYIIIATSDFGCIDSANITVYVICDHSQVFMPNSFTPNGDGINDRFYPRGKGLKTIKSFRIYDRWGQMIFQQQNINTNDKGIGWDGTYKGVLLSPDVFVYVIDAICDTDQPISWQGNIALIR